MANVLRFPGNLTQKPETDNLNIQVINVSEFRETKTASSSKITNTESFEIIELN